MTELTLYTSAQIRQLDQRLAAARAVPTFTLMQEAAQAALRVLRANWPQAGRVLIITGGGNNGGDGWMLAVLMQQAALQVNQQPVMVQVIACSDPAALSGDAAEAFACAERAGVAWQAYAAAALPEQCARADVLVDAMLGTGLSGALRAPLDEVVRQLNAAGKPLLAIDVPTGLQADTGRVDGVVLRADITVTLVAPKRGQFTADGPDHCGRLVLDDLGWQQHSAAILTQSPALRQDTVALLDRKLLQQLPARRSNSHKHDYGRVLVIAGQPGMAGAGLLSAIAALRSGAGLVVLATHAAHAADLHAAQPELMIRAIPALTADIHAALGVELQAADAVVFGPGIGRDDWAGVCWQALQQEIARRATALPLVVDADGLYWLQQQPLTGAAAVRMHEQLILTPHSGEAARLLDCTASEVQQQRFEQARALARRWQALVVLKGNGSIVATADGTLALCAAGHPGMATAGSGDVLSGICAALQAARAQPGQASSPLTPQLRVAAAVLAHALAAEQALPVSGPNRRGGAGMLATDIVQALPQVLA